jgi:hypothetical protein
MFSDRILYDDWSCKDEINFLTVTTDGTMWAITCYQGSPTVIIGRFDEAPDYPKKTTLKINMTLNEALWRPDSY